MHQPIILQGAPCIKWVLSFHDAWPYGICSTWKRAISCMIGSYALYQTWICRSHGLADLAAGCLQPQRGVESHPTRDTQIRNNKEYRSDKRITSPCRISDMRSSLRNSRKVHAWICRRLIKVIEFYYWWLVYPTWSWLIEEGNIRTMCSNRLFWARPRWQGMCARCHRTQAFAQVSPFSLCKFQDGRGSRKNSQDMQLSSLF